MSQADSTPSFMGFDSPEGAQGCQDDVPLLHFNEPTVRDMLNAPVDGGGQAPLTSGNICNNYSPVDLPNSESFLLHRNLAGDFNATSLPHSSDQRVYNEPAYRTNHIQSNRFLPVCNMPLINPFAAEQDGNSARGVQSSVINPPRRETDPFNLKTETAHSLYPSNIRIPAFWKNQVKAWFNYIECLFKLSNVSRDEVRYALVVSALDSLALEQISDILANPPLGDKYRTVKLRLEGAYSESQQMRISRLLSGLTLGDERPSQLLRRMKTLARDEVSERFLMSIWLQRLPDQIRLFISANDGNLDQLGQLADRLMETLGERSFTESSMLTSIGSNPSNQERYITLAEFDRRTQSILDRIDSMAGVRNQNVETATNQNLRPAFAHRRTRSKSREGDRSQIGRSDVCWYHRKFGEKATRCTIPCAYKKPQGNH